MIGRYHAPGSIESWIVLKTENPNVICEYVSQWAELLNLEKNPVLTDEEAAPIVAKVYR